MTLNLSVYTYFSPLTFRSSNLSSITNPLLKVWPKNFIPIYKIFFIPYSTLYSLVVSISPLSSHIHKPHSSSHPIISALSNTLPNFPPSLPPSFSPSLPPLLSFSQLINFLRGQTDLSPETGTSKKTRYICSNLK